MDTLETSVPRKHRLITCLTEVVLLVRLQLVHGNPRYPHHCEDQVNIRKILVSSGEREADGSECYKVEACIPSLKGRVTHRKGTCNSGSNFSSSFHSLNVSANTFTNNTFVNTSAGTTPCTGVNDATISGNESGNNVSTNGTLAIPSTSETQGAGVDATNTGNTSGNNTFVNPSAGNNMSANNAPVNPSAGATQSASVDDVTNCW
ncbi:hypothetical protein C8R42DRAFT_648288 [Lentinula raphanica]|nr:hypothetical protein C8R42DRAFT_648288 [Lentinula raphanica]